MLRINRTLISFAVAFFIAVMLMSARCFAFDYAKITGSTATGAQISGYDTAIQVDVTDFGADPTGQKDSYKAIQNALYYAVDNASDTVQLKVVIPEGTYIINRPLKIYSNTWLYMKGATIVRNFSVGFMFRNALQNPAGGYDGERNIIIEGGCFDGNTNSSSTPFSNVRLGHIRNLWINGVEFRDNYNGHLLEIGGAQNVTIENCTFHEYYGLKEKEAIQLDVMNNKEAFVHFDPFDDTACDNVVIRNNKFYDLMRGLGSHSATVGVYYTNVLISGNTFENITSTAMIMQNYKNCLVEDNTMQNVGNGIDFKYMTPLEYSGYNAPVAGWDGIENRINDNANTIIRKNTIDCNVTSYAPTPFGIQLYGRKLTGSYYYDYDYKVEGVKITDNKITTAGSAIVLSDTNGIQVKSNTVKCDSSGYYQESDLVIVRNSTDTSVQSNKVNDGFQSGIYVGDSSSKVTVKDNTCTSSGASGIYVSMSSSDVTVSGNKVKKAGYHGIKITKEASAELSENTVEESGGYGIMFTGGTGNAKKNTLFSNGKGGVYADGSVEVTVKENTIKNNGGYGITAADNSKIRIGHNSYEGNSEGEHNAKSGGTLSVDAPKKLCADGVYEEHVQLSWENVSEADEYVVLRKVSGSEDDYEAVAQVYSASYVDLGLSSRTKYEYKVQGIVRAGDSAFSGTGSDMLEIRTKAAVADCTVDMKQQMAYNGRAREQLLAVYYQGDRLVENVDYKVKYYNNTAVGTASVVITGCGQFCGLKELNFDIVFSNQVNQATDIPEKRNDFVSCAADGGSGYASERYQVKVIGKNKFDSDKRDEKTTIKGGQTHIQIMLEQLKQENRYRVTSRHVRVTGKETFRGIWV